VVRLGLNAYPDHICGERALGAAYVGGAKLGAIADAGLATESTGAAEL
jgi:hypothetical protein